MDDSLDFQKIADSEQKKQEAVAENISGPLKLLMAPPATKEASMAQELKLNNGKEKELIEANSLAQEYLKFKEKHGYSGIEISKIREHARKHHLSIRKVYNYQGEIPNELLNKLTEMKNNYHLNFSHSCNSDSGRVRLIVPTEKLNDTADHKKPKDFPITMVFMPSDNSGLCFVVGSWNGTIKSHRQILPVVTSREFLSIATLIISFVLAFLAVELVHAIIAWLTNTLSFGWNPEYISGLDKKGNQITSENGWVVFNDCISVIAGALTVIFGAIAISTKEHYKLFNRRFIQEYFDRRHNDNCEEYR